MNVHIRTADQVDSSKLDEFLSRLYPPSKSKFLQDHGFWWHQGDENRWVLMADDELAGYCAIIPTRVKFEGDVVDAIWWVDLIVAPEFRGRGLQTHFDDKIRGMSVLKLGFPNELAAKIHRKHGWGVREDFRTLLLPLQPTKVNSVRSAKGPVRFLLRAAAFGLIPLAAFMRWRYRSYQPRSARKVTSPSPEHLANIYHRYQTKELATTRRDETYIRWRFLDAPYYDQLSFYLAGPSDSPSHYLVTRDLERSGGLVTRILDFYGDFSDRDGLSDILDLAVKDAVAAGSNQVTVMLTLPALQSVFRSWGFLLSTVSRFCWIVDDPVRMEALGNQNHWALADSDNDTPE